MIAKDEVLDLGPHRVRCGDLLEGSVEALMGSEKADIVYSDPPWGEGNVRFWRTHNGQKDVAYKFDWLPFIRRFCRAVQACASPVAPVFIEMGQRWSDELASLMDEVGYDQLARWSVLYGNNLPCDVNMFWHKGAATPPEMPESLEGTKGLEVVRRAMKPFAQPGKLVLDPCTGLGMTAKLTIDYGMRFRGNELNPKRLQDTIDMIIKRTSPRTRRTT